VPDDIEDLAVEGEAVGIIDLIRQAGFASSNGEARRFVQQNAVSLDDEKVTDPFFELDLATAPLVLRVGKRRYARVVRA
jgi:tyrosyl-tRNA synthetase